jgi:hypothetical protein
MNTPCGFRAFFFISAWVHALKKKAQSRPGLRPVGAARKADEYSRPLEPAANENG